MNKTKKNIIYNVTYQILILIIPLITMPYVSRRLGADGIGVYSYSYSIVHYFMIFAMIGFNNYGNRTIAKSRNNKRELTKKFKEIYLLQVITSSIMIVSYLLFVLIFDHKYTLVFLLQSLYVISCMFDINWFFFGMEEFKLTVTRNTIIKIISLFAIFLFVRSKEDVWIYTLILSSSTLLSQIALWPFVNKRIDKSLQIKLDIKSHVKPCFKLFLPVIAVSIYKIMDKTMLGVLSPVEEVGFYENAEKIISVPNAIITAVGTVMLPKMSNLYANSKFDDESKKIIKNTMSVVMFLCLAMGAGIISIGMHFSTFFFGSEFAKSGILIQLLAITIVFLAWGNVIRTQFLIPKERDKEYIISAFLGAIINFVMNLIFIPKYASIGACFGTIAAELSVMLYQTFAVRKELPIKEYVINSIPFMIKATIMLIIIYPFNFIQMNSLYRLIIQVILGCLIYGLLNIKYIYHIISIKDGSFIKTVN